MMRLPKLGAVFIVMSLVWIQRGVALKPQRTEEAYVTLLYGDEFVLGVRVLGKSIRDSGSNKDMVVLVSDGVSHFSVSLLQADGWIVEKISLLANPNHVRPKRFWGVYTKLKIFNMTNYRKVVYLDADTIVVKNIDDLFKCGKFCANLKHSERLNSGVMVVEPSHAVFNDMMTKVNTLQSYTGGDQGFLNSYYPDFPNAHLFQPNIPDEVFQSRPVPEMERLSTLYNADVGLYMLANKWMVDESELRVIHYTLGPLKPWDWWTSWLLKPVDVWQVGGESLVSAVSFSFGMWIVRWFAMLVHFWLESWLLYGCLLCSTSQRVREQLEESLPGTFGGGNRKDTCLVILLFLLPLCTVLFCYRRSLLQTQTFCRSSPCDHFRRLYYIIISHGAINYSGISSSSAFNSPHKFSNAAQSKVPTYLGVLSVFTCFMAAFLSLAFSLALVPRQVMPWTGLLLLYEWTFTMFSLLFGGFLHFTHLWGRMVAAQAASISPHPESPDDDPTKGHQRQGSIRDFGTCHYWLGMAVLAVFAPSIPCIFGITALFARLGLMVVGALALASFMTYASEHLAIRSFLKGFEDRDPVRSWSTYFLC